MKLSPSNINGLISSEVDRISFKILTIIAFFLLRNVAMTGKNVQWGKVDQAEVQI